MKNNNKNDADIVKILFQESRGTRTTILTEQFSKLQSLVDILPSMLSKAKYNRIIEILDELKNEIDILKIKVEKEKGALI